MRIFICILFFLFVGNVPAGANLRDGLVGWWKMDEGAGTTVNDASASGYSLTLQNSPAWVTGCSRGNCLSFNGSSQYLKGASTLSLSGSSVSIAFWVYFRANAGWSTLISKANATNNSTAWDWGVLMQNGANGIYLIRNGSNVNPTGTAISTNTWTHVVGTMNDTASKVYFNGALIDTQGGIGSGNTQDTAGRVVNIAGSNSSDFVNAVMDDVRVYNRILSDQEVKDLYNAGVSIKNAVIKNAVVNR